MIDGFTVTQVKPSGAAERLGLRTGDVILDVNGQVLDGMPTVMRLVRSAAVRVAGDGHGPARRPAHERRLQHEMTRAGSGRGMKLACRVRARRRRGLARRAVRDLV
ncbi:MAG: PDZ domain-containing protein [Desulfobacterales bacterium]|nr:PDZ domain-containing protein [Desulfobacterales bacterium]